MPDYDFGLNAVRSVSFGTSKFEDTDPIKCIAEDQKLSEEIRKLTKRIDTLQKKRSLWNKLLLKMQEDGVKRAEDLKDEDAYEYFRRNLQEAFDLGQYPINRSANRPA